MVEPKKPLARAFSFVCGSAVLTFIALSIPIQSVLPQEQVRRGEVQGKIVMTKGNDTNRPAPKVDRYGTHRTPSTGPAATLPQAPAYKLSQQAVVFLESDRWKGQKFPISSTRPMMDQRAIMFTPRVLPILVGTIVDFPNSDNLFHNVFSYSQTKDFDLGRYPTGESRSVLFERAGVVRVYCDIHAHMNATILVLDNPYFATPDDEGHYSIKNIPEGLYTLKLWFGRDTVETRSVTIKSGETTMINLTY